jgi:hypothetical protein
LQKHEFDNMRPEFLLHTAMQLRSRLNEFRSDTSPNVPIEQTGLRPLSITGCLSHSENEVPAATGEKSSPVFQTGAETAQVNGHHRPSLDGSSNGKSEHPNRTNPDKNGGRLESDHSSSTPCNGRSHALVRFAPLERAQPCAQSSPASTEAQSSPEISAESKISHNENRTNPDKNGSRGTRVK